MKSANILAIALLVVGLGVGFFVGMKYQQGNIPAGPRQLAFNGGARGFGQRSGNGNGNFRPVAGQIIAADSKSITVKMNDGSSKIVFLAGNTSINKASKGSITDLKVNERVAVFGTENSDGSMTAQSIQLNPTIFRIQGSPSASPAM